MRPSRFRVGPALALLAGALAAAAASAGDDAGTPVSRPIQTDPLLAARAAAEHGDIVRMRWKLGGLLGTLASLFLPSSGNALFTFIPHEGGRVEIGALITAPKRKGEYFLYGAEIDESRGTTTAVWNQYVFRGEEGSSEQRIDEPDVIGYASVVYRLLRFPPEGVTKMKIWDDDKLYPVEITPLGVQQRKVSGKMFETRGYEVEGVRTKQGEPVFRIKLFLYFSTGDPPVPVEIIGKRGLVRVRFELVDGG